MKAPRKLGVGTTVATVALLAGAGLAPGAAEASDAQDVPRIEVSLGAGGASAAEKSLFNLASDFPSKPDVLMDVRVRQNLDRHFAFGFHAYGTTERTPAFFTTDAIGNALAVPHYRLTLFQVGADLRYALLEPPLQPFVELGVSYVSGSLEDDNREVLRSSGGTIGGGPGVQYVFSTHWAAGGQGLFAAGSAKWAELPYARSTSRDYDPGFAGAEGFVTFRWFH